MTDPHDTLAEYELAIACLAEEVRAGRKLTPAEMLAAVDSEREQAREAAE